MWDALGQGRGTFTTIFAQSSWDSTKVFELPVPSKPAEREIPCECNRLLRHIAVPALGDLLAIASFPQLVVAVMIMQGVREIQMPDCKSRMLLKFMRKYGDPHAHMPAARAAHTGILRRAGLSLSWPAGGCNVFLCLGFLADSVTAILVIASVQNMPRNTTLLLQSRCCGKSQERRSETTSKFDSAQQLAAD